MSLAVDEGIAPCCCSIIACWLTGEQKRLDTTAAVEERALWSADGGIEGSGVEGERKGAWLASILS